MLVGMRLEDTLAAITEDWFLGVEGVQYKRQLRRALDSKSLVEVLRIESALSLGAHEPPTTHNISPPTGAFKDRAVATARKLASPVHRVIQSDGSTQRRRAQRACMLAEIIMKKRQTNYAARIGAGNSSVNLTIDNLARYFKNCFPVSDMYRKTAAWSSAFTEPGRHNPANFCYIVHAIRLDEGPVPGSNAPYTPASSLLTDTSILQSWSAISCSVINERRSHTFRSCGLILNVPPANILVTAPHDVGFRNHAGLNPPDNAGSDRLLEIQGSFLEEIRSKNAQYKSTSPERILKGTGKIGDARPYNEIVVAGRSFASTATTVVTVVGLFVQDAECSPGQKRQMETASKALKLPLVRL